VEGFFSGRRVGHEVAPVVLDGVAVPPCEHTTVKGQGGWPGPGAEWVGGGVATAGLVVAPNPHRPRPDAFADNGGGEPSTSERHLKHHPHISPRGPVRGGQRPDLDMIRPGHGAAEEQDHRVGVGVVNQFGVGVETNTWAGGGAQWVCDSCRNLECGGGVACPYARVLGLVVASHRVPRGRPVGGVSQPVAVTVPASRTHVHDRGVNGRP